jgi:ectoine hydroxylase-related dioxygenase (phytanoyl-CoA dioxygenase family)
MSAPTTFKAVPSQDELDSMNRDLRFHPVVNLKPKTLSPAQIEQFNREGYLKPFRIFNETEAADLRAYFDRLLAKVMAEGGNSYSISTAHAKYGRVFDVLTSPRIVALMRDLLGENVIAWGSHFFCKMPGDGKTVSWHQDASYWPLTPTKAVTCWLAIDDADRENACMKFIPGSHHYGHLTYKMSEDSESNILDQTVENAEGIGKPVYDELKAGECSLHSDLLLHGSEANTSTRRRCGLTLRFCSAEVVAGLGWYEKGIWVSGRAVPGTWANRPRPETE